MRNISFFLLCILSFVLPSHALLVIVKNNSTDRCVKIRHFSIQQFFYGRQDQNVASINANSRKTYVAPLPTNDFCYFSLLGSFGILKIKNTDIRYNHFIVSIKSQRKLSNSDTVVITLDHNHTDGASATLDVAAKTNPSSISSLKSKLKTVLNFRNKKSDKDYDDELPANYIPALIEIIQDFQS